MKLPEGYVAGVAPKKATAMGGYGQSMLEKMGWAAGQGLGKAKQGRSSHIEVQFKDDKAGLGGKYTWDWEKNYASDAFEQAVAKIGGLDNDGSASDSSSSDSDDEDGIALNRDGTVANAQAAELKLARQLAKGNNLGRFGARAGKLARLREQEAKLAAAYGLPTATAEPIRKRKAAADAPNTAELKKSRKALIIEVKDPSRVDNSLPSAPPPLHPESWWGHKYFASAGWLGGMNDDESVRERQNFNSNIQEDIYNKLKEQERKGRRGMGKREVKVMGTKWEGSKKTFEENGSDQSSTDVGSASVAEGDASRSQAAAPPLKFIKVVKRCIKKNSKGKVKLSKLEVAVAELLGQDQSRIAAKLQKRIDSGALSFRKGWVSLS